MNYFLSQETLTIIYYRNSLKMNSAQIIDIINLALGMISSENINPTEEQKVIIGKIIQGVYCDGEYIVWDKFFGNISSKREYLEVNVPKLTLFKYVETILVLQLKFLKQELETLSSSEIISSIDESYGEKLMKVMDKN